MTTKERLAKALEEAAAPPSMIVAARLGRYDDFESESATPIMDLVKDARANALTDIAERAMNGEFDATKEESEQWARGDGAELIKSLNEDEGKRHRVWWGIHERVPEQGNLLNGPYGCLLDKAQAERVAKELYGENGVVKETNPDHMQEWGFGRGSCTLSGEPDKPFDRTWVRDTPVDLLFGEHPHGRKEENIYARWPDGRIEGFDGHRLLHQIEFRDYNYLKTSGLSGNEVRRGGECKIWINGFACGKFFYRDINEALDHARQHLVKVHNFNVQLWRPKDRSGIVGRKVYYHNEPAKITYFFAENLDVALEHDGPGQFPKLPWHEEPPEDTITDSIFSPHIWWWRE